MNSVDEIQKQISDLQLKIIEIQTQCSHPAACLKKTHGGNTGNYDPTADCYWTDFNCGLCKKKWTEDGSK